MEKEETDLNITEELVEFRKLVFKLSSLFFVIVIALFYVIPNVFWFFAVEYLRGYLGVTTYTVVALLTVVFVFVMWRAMIPVKLIEEMTKKYWKDVQGFVELTEEEQKALDSVKKEENE